MPFLPLNGTRFAYRDHGPNLPETQTVILLHGSLSTGGQWRRLIEELSRDFRVLAPDLHGYGHSPSYAGDPAKLIEAETAVVAALMEMAPGPIHLVGHSYGGLVALAVARTVAAKAPDRLVSLTLIEPALFPMLPRDGADGRALWRLAGRTVRDVRAGRAARAARRFIGYWHGFGRWYTTPRKARNSVLSGIGKVSQEFAAILATEPFQFPDETALPVPLAVVRGARTTRTCHAIVERILAARPDARHFQVRGAGHMAPITHKAAVNKIIAGFVRRTAAASRGEGQLDVAA